MANGAKSAVLDVQGMRNNSCRERIVDALGRVSGVQEVNVSLVRARATVVYGPPCEPSALVRAVQGAGYFASVNGKHDDA